MRVDSDLMRQAILNLVLNGLQSMTGDGTLTLKARRDDEMILAEVLDQGCGIPAAAQEKIFELYFTTKKDGSGMGLAYAYQILESGASKRRRDDGLSPRDGAQACWRRQ